jgi:hypothetical protein
MPCVGQLPYGSSYLPNPGMDLGSTIEIIGESAAGVCVNRPHAWVVVLLTC